MVKKIWTEKEEALLREKYPRYGTCCLEHFPGRTKQQLLSKVGNMGLTIPKTFKDSKVKGRLEYIETREELQRQRDEIYSDGIDGYGGFGK